jgi:hypothetical protein
MRPKRALWIVALVLLVGTPAAEAIDYCIRTCNSEVPCSTECVSETEPWFIITCGEYGDCGSGLQAQSGDVGDLFAVRTCEPAATPAAP